MAKRFQKVVFDPNGTGGYLADRGTEHFASSGFYAPPDMDEAAAALVAGAAGGAANGETPPCSDNADFRPRKLRFIRTGSGQQNTITVPIGNRTDLVAAAGAIRDLLNGLSADYQVVCIQLLGEKWDNVYDELRTSTAEITPGEDSRPTDDNSQQFVYSAQYTYDIDFDLGQRIIPIKINTESQGNVPSIYATPWLTCVPDARLQAAITCRGRQPIEHRRYLVDSLVNRATGTDQDGNPVFGNPNRSQSAEVPVLDDSGQEIFACGTDLANLSSSICLGYQGESNSRFDKLVP